MLARYRIRHPILTMGRPTVAPSPGSAKTSIRRHSVQRITRQQALATGRNVRPGPTSRQTSRTRAIKKQRPDATPHPVAIRLTDEQVSGTVAVKVASRCKRCREGRGSVRIGDGIVAVDTAMRPQITRGVEEQDPDHARVAAVLIPPCDSRLGNPIAVQITHTTHLAEFRRPPLNASRAGSWLRSPSPRTHLPLRSGPSRRRPQLGSCLTRGRPSRATRRPSSRTAVSRTPPGPRRHG